MSLTNKLIPVLLTSALGLGMVNSALASGSEHAQRRMPAGHGLFQLESLTDAQRNEIQTIMKNERKGMRDLTDAMRDNQMKLQEAMQKNASINSIKPLAKKQGELVTKSIIERARMQSKINAVLTEEQRKELMNMKPQRPMKPGSAPQRSPKRDDDDD